jgi:hypothetical protein
MSSRKRKQYKKFLKAREEAFKAQEKADRIYGKLRRPPRGNRAYINPPRRGYPPPPGLGYDYEYDDLYYDEEGGGANGAIALLFFALILGIAIAILFWFYSGSDTRDGKFFATFVGSVFLALSVLVVAIYLYYYSNDYFYGDDYVSIASFRATLFFGFLGVLGIVMIVVAQTT